MSRTIFNHIVQEDKEEHRENKGLSRAITAKAKVTCLSSAQNQGGSVIPSGSRIKFYCVSPASVLLLARLLAIPTLPPSPLSPLSSPLPRILSPLPQILSPPLPISSPPLHASPTYLLGYRAVMIRLKAEAPSTSHPLPSSKPPSGTPPLLHIPLPTSSPPFLLPSTSRRADFLEVTLPPQKRLCIVLGLRFEVDESSSAPTARPTEGFRADYGFVGTLDDEIRQDPGREVGYGITDT
nr:hypothetical protein [Tanacetum cinerariifolium]